MKPKLDLNLLFIAEALYRHLNVSKAAKELGMSQSAVSHSLAKLREHFHDPLFVRVSKGMAATDLAIKLRPSIEDLTQNALDLTQKSAKFNPKTAKGRMTLATTDMIEILLMPNLIKRLQKEAPGIQISLRATGGELPKDELESGAFDFAIAGFYKNLPEGFYQSKILETVFATAYSKNHSTIRKELTAAQYYEEHHALITLQGDFKDVPHPGASRKRVKKIVFGSHSFTGLAWTIASTDLVLTAPLVLLQKYQEYFPIHVQRCPVEMPKINIKLVWHSLTHKDPLRIWFRELLRSEMSRYQ